MVMDVLRDCGIDLNQFSSFQPTHARIIGAHFRRRERTWSDDTKEQIADLVQQCEDEAWTVERLKDELEDMDAPPIDPQLPNQLALLSEIPPGQKFGCIYADPPWRYGNQATRASTDKHYNTMSLADICAMPVGDFAADDAHLHLWTTNAFLFDAREVMQAWGFEYKSCFIWVKPQMGIGNYWRVSHEFLLLGIRGKQRFRDHSLMSWGSFRRGRHSAKPEEIRNMIERSSPGPYLELFGRSLIDGWTVLGNQIEKRLFA